MKTITVAVKPVNDDPEFLMRLDEMGWLDGWASLAEIHSFPRSCEAESIDLPVLDLLVVLTGILVPVLTIVSYLTQNDVLDVRDRYVAT